MASKIVFFILTVVKVKIVWTESCHSDVHEMMTPEEIFQTFGTINGSVPDYQVICMELPEARRRDEADDEINLRVKIKNKDIDLTFKPVNGFLATKYVPVWFAVTDPKAYNNIRYDPIPNAMEDIGEFKMYQDVSNDAAIVVYTDPDHETVIEGIVTLEYAIRSLPKRLMNQTLKVGSNHFIESPVRHERSIDLDANEVTGYVALFKSPPSAENTKRNMYRHVEELQSHSRERRQNRPESVFPEILLVLDYNAIRNHTITQALRFMLALWNGVDMIFSTLNDPKVHLNIAGIIISADDAATPYINEDTSITIKSYSHNITEQLAEYFASELKRFPVIQYDIIVAMTPTTFCLEETDSCQILLGFASGYNACTSELQAMRWNRINGVAVMYYNWMFGGVATASHEIAHLFDVGHDEGIGATAQCNYTEGYAMAPSIAYRQQNSKWSPCSEMYFQHFFSSMESQCLDNTPMSIEPVKDVLYGRWLSLDGQCQNRGFEKSCQISGEEFNICMHYGCQAEKSNECEISQYIPLAGTKCGENKYCELGTGCVDE